MASEDSDQLMPGFPSVHRLHDLGDLSKTLTSLVTILSHQFDAEGELLEVAPLGRTKRMLPEARNYPFEQILSTTNDVAMKVLPVVVMPPVDVHLSRSKELAQLMQTRDAACALRHHEVMRDLVSGRVAAAARPAWLPDESD
jgi:hypothetical protein